MLLPAALLFLALAPVGASAESHTFLNTDNLGPTEGAGTFGPANHYPSSITVSGLSGTVTKVTATVLDLHSASPADIDMVLRGPNGQQVMLMSDACGDNPKTVAEDDWTFDDSAESFLSEIGCPSGQNAGVKPTNYGPPELDDLSQKGGPTPPYLNAMSFLSGGSPDGVWSLFVLDDNPIGFVGFTIDAWALTLEVEPPPPTIVPVQTPAPPPAPAVQVTKAPTATGKRAAALAKCKAKKSKKARKQCKAKAQALPV